MSRRFTFKDRESHKRLLVLEIGDSRAVPRNLLNSALCLSGGLRGGGGVETTSRKFWASILREDG